MARKYGKDRGILQRRGRKGWWVRFYVNGREKWERCDTKSQAKALYGRRKAEQREGKYFEKPKIILFREIADEYIQSVDRAAPVSATTQPAWGVGFAHLEIKTPIW